MKEQLHQGWCWFSGLVLDDEGEGFSNGIIEKVV